jgi:hypothetical protein
VAVHRLRDRLLEGPMVEFNARVSRDRGSVDSDPGVECRTAEPIRPSSEEAEPHHTLGRQLTQSCGQCLIRFVDRAADSHSHATDVRSRLGDRHPRVVFAFDS